MADQWDIVRNATREFTAGASKIATDIISAPWRGDMLIGELTFGSLPWVIAEDLLALRSAEEKCSTTRESSPRELVETALESQMREDFVRSWKLAPCTSWLIEHHPDSAAEWVQTLANVPKLLSNPGLFGSFYELRTGFTFQENGVLAKNFLTKKKQAIYYTPNDVVDFILRHALDPLLDLIATTATVGALEDAFGQFSRLSVLDPACGGGAFLLAAWNRLVSFHDAHFRGIGNQPLPHPILYGVDIDPRATQVANFSMWLATPASHPLGGAYVVLQGNALWPEPATTSKRRMATEPSETPSMPRFSFPEQFPHLFSDPQNAGFQCVVGNPPYADIPPNWSRDELALRFQSARSKDLYSLFLEQMVILGQRAAGRGGLIVPLSLTFSKEFQATREFILSSRRRWKISSYHIRPSGIFPGVSQRTSIALVEPSPQGETRVETTCVQRWVAEDRDRLFDHLRYADVTACMREIQAQRRPLGFPSVGDPTLSGLLLKLLLRGECLHDATAKSAVATAPAPLLYYFTMAYHWLTISARLPDTSAAGKPVALTSLIPLPFVSDEARWTGLALLASSLGFWWWQVFGDLFHVTRTVLTQFPVNPANIPPDVQQELGVMARELQDGIDQAVTYFTKKGVTNANFDLTRAFSHIARIDAALWDYLGVTPEEVAALYANYTQTTGKTILTR
ncbi:MAG TPA: DNA methyltransferase [Candidatus Lokiarchaeia archaeon]|nr:DNA methyltransferase [Candidatus Lokiarchaeia archaeon]